MLLSFAGFGSPTPEGPINPFGGVVGSYEVRITNLGNGTALFLVRNETNWASGTRIPGTGYSLLPPLKREETTWGTTILLAEEALLLPVVAPGVSLFPKLAQPIREVNEAAMAITAGWPGGGGIGGQLVQYYWWTEPIPPEGER